MIDFSKNKVGDIMTTTFVCDDCARKRGCKPKSPPDSGTESFLCDVCGHHGIGSTMPCKIDPWLILHPLQTIDILK
jgi:hypothetical protein